MRKLAAYTPLVLTVGLFGAACSSTVSGTADGESSPRAEEVPTDSPATPGPSNDPSYPDTPTVPAPASAVFHCDPSAERPESQSLVLTKTQLTHSLSDLFGEGVLQAAQTAISVLPSEVFDDVTHVRQSTLTESKVEAYYGIAQAVAAYVVADDARLSSVFGACAAASTVDTACLDGFLDGFARRILRRPLTVSEKSFSRDLLTTGPGNDREQLGAVLSYLLASPHFLWRIEVGERSDDGRIVLTPYEVATRIAYVFTNSTPDASLHRKAENGELGTVTAIRDEARRLLSSPRGRDKLASGIARWSLMDRTADLSNLPSEILQGADTDTLSEAMIREAREFIDTVVFDNGATFEELLTSPLSFAQDPELASIYGHSPASPGAPATMSERRRGLLLRAPALTSTGPRASIINRGVDIQLRILCNEIPEPNVDIADARDNNEPSEEEQLTMSNRDVVAATTSAAVCQACHATINPTGFVFEAFDSMGRIRESEQVFDHSGGLHGNVEIDTSADVPLPEGGFVSMSDAYDFVGWVAESDVGKACFARNMMRYLTERDETPGDECNLNSAASVLLDPSTPIVDLVVEALVHDDFLTKQLTL